MTTEDAFISKSTVESSETIQWEDGNEYPLVKLEISAHSHPFFTGKMQLWTPRVVSTSSAASTASGTRRKRRREERRLTFFFSVEYTTAMKRRPLRGAFCGRCSGGSRQSCQPSLRERPSKRPVGTQRGLHPQAPRTPSFLRKCGKPSAPLEVDGPSEGMEMRSTRRLARPRQFPSRRRSGLCGLRVVAQTANLTHAQLTQNLRTNSEILTSILAGA